MFSGLSNTYLIFKNLYAWRYLSHWPTHLDLVVVTIQIKSAHAYENTHTKTKQKEKGKESDEKWVARKKKRGGKRKRKKKEKGGKKKGKKKGKTGGKEREGGGRGAWVLRRVGPHTNHARSVWMCSPAKRANNANNATHSVKLGKKRRKSSNRNYYIISRRVIMKAININGSRSRSWDSSKSLNVKRLKGRGKVLLLYLKSHIRVRTWNPIYFSRYRLHTASGITNIRWDLASAWCSWG